MACGKKPSTVPSMWRRYCVAYMKNALRQTIDASEDGIRYCTVRSFARRRSFFPMEWTSSCPSNDWRRSSFVRSVPSVRKTPESVKGKTTRQRTSRRNET